MPVTIKLTVKNIKGNLDNSSYGGYIADGKTYVIKPHDLFKAMGFTSGDVNDSSKNLVGYTINMNGVKKNIINTRVNAHYLSNVVIADVRTTIKNYYNDAGLLWDQKNKTANLVIKKEDIKVSTNIKNIINLEYTKISDSLGCEQYRISNETIKKINSTAYVKNVNEQYAITPNGKMFKFKEINNKKIIVEYVDGEPKDVWLGVAQVGKNYRLGYNDIIYKKTIKIDNNKMFNYWHDDIQLTNSPIVGSMEIKEYNNNELVNKKNYMYYDYSAGRFITLDEWQYNIHYEERNTLSEMNEITKKVLPQTVDTAKSTGFYLVPKTGTKYHDGALGNLKFIHKDGREVIFVCEVKTMRL